MGYSYSYNPVTVDNDYDSLSYAFDYPFASNGSGTPYGPMQFVSPYSVNNPLPGNPTINSITGEMTVFPIGALQGNYATCIRVDSYRCGVKIASVFREIQVVLTNQCSGGCDGTGNNQNDPPVISPAPFQNSVTGLYTDYTDTVLVGDTVSFTLNVLEMETLVSDCITPQHFFINLNGSQVDSVFGSPYTQCDIPPCAHLDIITPAGPFTYNKTVHFNWAIDCAHATNECSEYTSYFFAINANDDACPTPALNTKTIEVVVRGLHIVSNGDTLSVNTPYTNIQWYLNGVLIPGATDDTLITTNSGGIYTVQTLSPSGCSLISNEINIVHVGISDNVSSINNLTLYPNPVSSLLHVELKSKVVESAQLKIMDGLGRELKQELIQLSNRNNSFDISTNDLQNGIYYLSIKGKENICSKRIIVMH